MTSDDDLDRRLKAIDSLPGGIAHTAASRARLDEIRLRARSGTREPDRRAGWRSSFGRRAVVIASAVGVLGVGGAAAATVLGTSTVVGAPGFCQTAIDATANIPFPPGAQAWRNWALLQSAIRRQGATLQELCDNPDSPAAGAAGSGPYHGPFAVNINVQQAAFAHAAFCAWTTEWLKATTDGDTASASTAAEEINGALQWPASEAADPNPQPETEANDGTVLGWFINVQQAIAAGDVASVTSLFAPPSNASSGRFPAEACWFSAPPANSDNGTVVPANPEVALSELETNAQ